MTPIESEVDKDKAAFIERNKGRRDALFLARVCEDLASEKTQSALSAVDQLRKIGDTRMLLVAMKYPSRSVQIRAARGLRENGDKSMLPELIVALEKANVDRLKGGTETMLNNRELKSELVATIAKHAGVKYGGSSDYTVVEVKEFITHLEQEGFSKK